MFRCAVVASFEAPSMLEQMCRWFSDAHGAAEQEEHLEHR